LKIDGFKEKSSDNLINALLKIKDKNCLDILVASNLLGRGLGERKLKLIFDKYPYICSNQKEGLKLTINDIKNINGYGEISAKLFIENLNKFYEFYNSLNIPIKDDEEDEGDDEGFKGEVKELKGKEKKTKKMNEKYKDKTFVFSGFRNKDLETEIKDNGGDVSSTVSKKTTALIVKDLDKDKETTKIKNAIKFDIPIILYDDFIK
jgi:NAD-dependent DNA ligase